MTTILRCDWSRIFSDLRRKFAELHPVLLTNPNRARGFLSTGAVRGNSSGVWQLSVEACPVQCGGGWSKVEHSCKSQLGGDKVRPIIGYLLINLSKTYSFAGWP